MDFPDVSLTIFPFPNPTTLPIYFHWDWNWKKILAPKLSENSFSLSNCNHDMLPHYVEGMKSLIPPCSRRPWNTGTEKKEQAKNAFHTARHQDMSALAASSLFSLLWSSISRISPFHPQEFSATFFLSFEVHFLYAFFSSRTNVFI